MYYLGDIHVLDEVAYRLKIIKPQKVAARILQEGSSELGVTDEEKQIVTEKEKIQSETK